VQWINTKTGEPVEPILVDQATGRPIQRPDYAPAAGPAAGERTRRRYAAVAPQLAPAEGEPTPTNVQRRIRKRSAR
jgi:hypothetical protein